MPYLYHWFDSFPRSEAHSRSIAWKEVQDAGFQAHSSYNEWHYFFTNPDTLVLVSNVPLSPSNTHVHVVATSDNDQSANMWAADLMKRIRESKLTPID